MIKYKTTKECVSDDTGKKVKYTFTGSFLKRSLQPDAPGVRNVTVNHDVIFTGKELNDRAYMAIKLRSEKVVHRRHCRLVFRTPKVQTKDVVTQEGRSDPVVEVDLKAYARTLGSADKGATKK